MKFRLLARALVAVSVCVPLVVAAACSSTPDPVPAPSKDAGGGQDSGAADTAPLPTADSGADAAGDGPASHAFGADCTGPADCDSMVCFLGGTRSFCSLHCDAAAAGADCPKPPTTGTCNTKGYCK